MYCINISLYPLACEQRLMFNIRITHIPSIFKFHTFGSFSIHSIDAGLRVKNFIGYPRRQKDFTTCNFDTKSSMVNFLNYGNTNQIHFITQNVNITAGISRTENVIYPVLSFSTSTTTNTLSSYIPS